MDNEEVEARDPNSVVEANVFHIAAMFSYWARELKAPCDFDKLLGLSSVQRAMYRQMAKPSAEATDQEGSVAVARRIRQGCPKVRSHGIGLVDTYRSMR